MPESGWGLRVVGSAPASVLSTATFGRGADSLVVGENKRFDAPRFASSAMRLSAPGANFALAIRARCFAASCGWTSPFIPGLSFNVGRWPDNERRVFIVPAGLVLNRSLAYWMATDSFLGRPVTIVSGLASDPARSRSATRALAVPRPNQMTCDLLSGSAHRILAWDEDTARVARFADGEEPLLARQDRNGAASAHLPTENGAELSRLSLRDRLLRIGDGLGREVGQLQREAKGRAIPAPCRDPFREPSGLPRGDSRLAPAMT